MDSNANQGFNQQANSGLLRYRSAPSWLFDCGGHQSGLNPDSESAERLFSRFVDYGNNNNSSDNDNGESESAPDFRDLDDKSAVVMSSSGHQKYSGSGLPPHYPRQGLGLGLENGSFGLVTSMAMENHHQSQAKSLSSGLVRQSSSPAGLFSHISVPNGYAAIKGATNFSGLDCSREELSQSSNRLKTQISFSSRLPSSLGMLSQISEVGTESLGAGTIEEEKLGNGNGDARFYGTGFPFGSWNDSSNFTDNYGGLRRDQEKSRKLSSGILNEELGNRIHVLSHHLSLPKSSGELAMEKFLHFQDSVPCKVRAKRGCATHPRSIAERVRRTRISERMRKLQELVPNMDKQTNTADMLDLAVDYIKDLQKQYKTLSDNRANCKCISLQKPIQNQVV